MLTSEGFLLLLLDVSEGVLESETRVQKLAFLGIREKHLPKFTSFVWEKYGPLSKELWETRQEMKLRGLLDIKEETRFTLMGDSYKVRTLKLTQRGRLMAETLKREMRQEYASIQELYYEYGKEPLNVLLDYVHSAYSRHDL